VTPIVKLKDYFNDNDMLVINIKTEYEKEFSDWKMLAERFEVKKYNHLVKGSEDATIIPSLKLRPGEALFIKNRLQSIPRQYALKKLLKTTSF